MGNWLVTAIQDSNSDHNANRIKEYHKFYNVPIFYLHGRRYLTCNFTDKSKVSTGRWSWEFIYIWRLVAQFLRLIIPLGGTELFII